MEPDYTIKILLAGETGTGKTKLMQRYTKEIWDPERDQTIGVDIGFKKIKMGDKVIKLLVYDLGGSPKYKTITKAYYRNTAAVFFCFPLDTPDALKKIPTWIKEIQDDLHESTYKLLVGTKSDTPRQITKEECELFYENHQKQLDGYIETSAKSGENITNLFELAISNVMTRIRYASDIRELGIRTKNTLRIDYPESSSSLDCCNLM